MKAGSRFILALLAYLYAVAAAANFASFQAANNGAVPPSFTPAWQTLNIGAGGQITGIDLRSDGTMVARNDTYGAHLYRATGSCTGWQTSYIAPCWEQLVTSDTIPGTSDQQMALVDTLNVGTVEVVACDSNTNVGYLIWNGSLWVTTNLKTTHIWTQIPSAQWSTTMFGGGDPPKSRGKYIYCDPHNPDIVYASTGAAVKYSTNGTAGASATFSTVTGIGTQGTYPSVFFVDPNSTFPGNITQRFWIATYGSDVYLTTNGGPAGGGSFTATTAPTAAKNYTRGCVDKFSTLWLGSGTNDVYKYASSWSTISSVTNSQVAVVACDPTATVQANNRVLVGGYSGAMSRSDNNGVTWTGDYSAVTLFSATVTSPVGQPTWLANANLGNGAIGNGFNLNLEELIWDSSDVLWYATGVGAFNTSWPVLPILTTTATTTTGNSVLTFASVPSSIVSGMYAADRDHSSIQQGTTVVSKTTTTVTLSLPVVSGAVGGVPSGDTIIFQPIITSNNVGIEQLTSNSIISGPGVDPTYAAWDRGSFGPHNPDTYPAHYWSDAYSNAYGQLQQIQGSWGVDYASTNSASSSQLCMANWEVSNVGSGQAPATSTDGGYTWALWANMPPAWTGFPAAGGIAMSSCTNILVAPGNNQPLAFSNNGGSTWGTSSFTAGPPGAFQYAAFRISLAADRVAATTYCAVDNSANFWRSTDGGANFAKVATAANVDGAGGGTNADIIMSAPGQSGHFWWSSAASTGSVHLWKSTNTCASWTNVNSNLTNVTRFGFGAAKPGGSGYPMVYAWGRLSGTLGAYASPDGGATWAAMNVPASEQVFPGKSLDFIRWFGGDANVYGRVYNANSGAGPAYIDLADACPYVNFSNMRPGLALSGTTSLQAQKSGSVPVTSVKFYVDGTLIGTQTSGTGTPTTYTQSWNASGVTPGAHALKVEAVGNGCTAGGGGNSFTIPVTTS